ncbi:MAG: hypothetical protein AAFU64_18010, partial [Bacteroidota bacterium]
MNQEDVLILKVVRELLENQVPTEGTLSALGNIGLPDLAALNLSLDEFKPGDSSMIEDPALVEIKDKIRELSDFVQKKQLADRTDPVRLNPEITQQINDISQALVQVKKIVEAKASGDKG